MAKSPLSQCRMPGFDPWSGFPGSSAGIESSCNARDPNSIPELGRSTGEGIGYPLQDSWAFLVARIVKNLPAMQEAWVQSWGWEDPLEKGKATHSSILTWRIPWGAKSWTQLIEFHLRLSIFYLFRVGLYLIADTFMMVV